MNIGIYAAIFFSCPLFCADKNTPESRSLSSSGQSNDSPTYLGAAYDMFTGAMRYVSTKYDPTTQEQMFGLNSIKNDEEYRITTNVAKDWRNAFSNKEPIEQTLLARVQKRTSIYTSLVVRIREEKKQHELGDRKSAHTLNNIQLMQEVSDVFGTPVLNDELNKVQQEIAKNLNDAVEEHKVITES
jgi:phosphomevalonate kinase